MRLQWILYTVLLLYCSSAWSTAAQEDSTEDNSVVTGRTDKSRDQHGESKIYLFYLNLFIYLLTSDNSPGELSIGWNRVKV